jgi:hypothetical protein
MTFVFQKLASLRIGPEKRKFDVRIGESTITPKFLGLEYIALPSPSIIPRPVILMLETSRLVSIQYVKLRSFLVLNICRLSGTLTKRRTEPPDKYQWALDLRTRFPVL